MQDLSNGNLLEMQDYSNLFGIALFGGAAKKDLKNDFESRYGSAWRAYWQTYKDKGGNKDKLSISWAIIDKFDVKEKSLAYKVGINLLNPASTVIRNGFLAAIEINLFGLAARLYPAYLSDADLKAGNLNLENAKKAKQALTQVELSFVRRLGGSKKSLKNAVLRGAKKKAAKLESIKNSSSFVESYSNEAGGTAAVITAALSFITAMVKAVADAGAAKNPYNSGSPENVYTGTDATGIDPLQAQKQLNDMPDLGDKTTFPTWGYFAIGAGVLVLLSVGGYFLLRKK